MKEWEVTVKDRTIARPRMIGPGIGTVYKMPCAITATDGTLTIDGVVDAIGGRLGFTSVTVQADGAFVTGERLRDVPMLRIIRTIAAMTLLPARPTAGGATEFAPFGNPPAGAGRGPSREQLEYLADLYRFARAAGSAPTKEVAAAFDVSLPTATRWAAKARAAGLLEDYEEDD